MINSIIAKKLLQHSWSVYWCDNCLHTVYWRFVSCTDMFSRRCWYLVLFTIYLANYIYHNCILLSDITLVMQKIFAAVIHVERHQVTKFSLGLYCRCIWKTESEICTFCNFVVLDKAWKQHYSMLRVSRNDRSSETVKCVIYAAEFALEL